jgi:hypothetical protein
MKVAPMSTLLGGEARATEVVGDELKVPKANSFTEGESTTCQMFTIGNDGKRT